MKYPKVLIIGEYFNLKSGGGITLSNLFKGWDKKNIAVIAERINEPDWGVCSRFYQIGYNDNKRIFPFFLWQPKYPSGLVRQEQPLDTASVVGKSKNNSTTFYLKKVYEFLMKFLGIYFYIRRIKMGHSLEKFISDFQPDIIYTQLSQPDVINFIGSLTKKLELPLVIHIMDDWPKTIGNVGLFKYFIKKQIDKKVYNLFKRASVLMSISDAMSEEYFKRYGVVFMPYHNPIDTHQWLQYTKTSYANKEKFIVLYAGRIGIGISDCLVDVADAIALLVQKGLPIELHIQTTSVHPVIDKLTHFDFVVIRGKAAYETLPSIFSSADLLIIANNFDEESIDYLKYSMPTKVSEYMVSGTPILVYASHEIGVTQHALKHKWALVVAQKNVKALSNAIEVLYNDEQKRMNLGTIARDFSTINYDAEIVRAAFCKSINSALDK